MSDYARAVACGVGLGLLALLAGVVVSVTGLLVAMGGGLLATSLIALGVPPAEATLAAVFALTAPTAIGLVLAARHLPSPTPR